MKDANTSKNIMNNFQNYYFSIIFKLYTCYNIIHFLKITSLCLFEKVFAKLLRTLKNVWCLFTELLQKNPEDLAMNAADNYRRIEEERYIIDRAIPAKDYGKGCKYTTISLGG